MLYTGLNAWLGIVAIATGLTNGDNRHFTFVYGRMTTINVDECGCNHCDALGNSYCRVSYRPHTEHNDLATHCVRTALVHIASNLTVAQYVSQIVLAVIRPLMPAVFGTLFQQDNAWLQSC